VDARLLPAGTRQSQNARGREGSRPAIQRKYRSQAACASLTAAARPLVTLIKNRVQDRGRAKSVARLCPFGRWYSGRSLSVSQFKKEPSSSLLSRSHRNRSAKGRCLGCSIDLISWFPVPRQKLGDAVDWMIGDAVEDIA
jgi:hypothetical protein